jgi:putative nucleotidyltransferase with HDIG domain
LITVGVLGEQNEALALLEALEKHSEHLYKHSIAVSLYSVLIAKAYGWSSPRTIVRLGICGFMHDIGKKEIPAEILQKSRVHLSADEIRLLETHARRGMEILSKLPGVPEEVPLVALQHHENNLGMGYPARLTKNKIVPISRLVALANTFCELVFKGPEYEGMSPENALQVISLNHQGMYDEDFVKTLHGIFKVPYREKAKTPQ